MNKVYIGKIVNTHGIKGEIRLLSDFPFKDKVFVVGNNILVDDIEYKINSYRRHKMFDMITLDGYNNINDVLFLMKKKVYFDKDKLVLSDDEILDEDLIKFKVIDEDRNIGKITEIFMASSTNKILRVEFSHEVLIPYNSPIIKSIDKEKKEIRVSLIGGM
mgnify:CR=1 FL=1